MAQAENPLLWVKYLSRNWNIFQIEGVPYHEHQAHSDCIKRIYWKSPQSKMMSATNTVFPPAVPFTDNELGFVSLQSSDLSLEQFNISLQLFKNKRGPVCSETCPRKVVHWGWNIRWGWYIRITGQEQKCWDWMIVQLNFSDRKRLLVKVLPQWRGVILSESLAGSRGRGDYMVGEIVSEIKIDNFHWPNKAWFAILMLMKF